MKRQLLMAVMLVLGALVAMADKVSYTADETITENLVLTSHYEIDVASGVTVTFGGVISCADGVTARLTKSGQGKLVLTAANTFNGGVVVGSGWLVAQNNDAFGTGAVVSGGGQIRLDVKDGVFTNDFSTTVNGSNMGEESGVVANQWASTGIQLYFVQSATVKGRLTADNKTFRIGCKRNGYSSSEGPYNNNKWPTATFDGEINLGANGTLAFHNNNGAYGNFVFKKKITCGTFNSGTVWSAMANLHFYAENAIGKFQMDSSKLYLYHSKALTGTEFYNYVCWDSGRGTIYPQVDEFELSCFTANSNRSTADNYPSGSSKTGADISRNTAYTVRITGSTITNTPVSYVRFRGPGTLVQDIPGATADSFVQTFDWVPSPMTGALIVSNGTMRITNGGGFPSATDIIVAEGAKFDSQSTAPDALISVTNLEVNGTLTIADTSTTAFRSDGKLALTLGANAALSTSQNLVLKMLKVGGEQKDAGTYNHANCSQLAEGTAVTVLSDDSQMKEYAWTGLGADTAITTAENWDTAAVVNRLTSGLAIPLFATSGTRATVDTDAFFGGIKFAAPGDFTVAGGGADRKMQIAKEGITSAKPESGTRAYAIDDLAMSVTTSATINLATNTTLTIRSSLAQASDHSLSLEGEGRLVLAGTNRIYGAIKHARTSMSELVLSGLITSYDGKDQGDAVFDGDKTITFYVPWKDRLGKSSRLRLENAIVKKPLAVMFVEGENGKNNSDDAASTFTCGAGTTNIIAGALNTSGMNGFIKMEKDSRLLIMGRLTSSSITTTPPSDPLAEVIYSNATTTASSSENVYMRGCVSYFYGSGWAVNGRVCCDGGRGVFMNDNVFSPGTACNLVMGDYWGSGNTAGVLDLNGTRQTFPRLMAMQRNDKAKSDLVPYITTPANKPAVLAITGTHSLNSTNNADITGPVTIEKSGDKAFCTVHRAVHTTGNLLISGGVFDIDADSSYPNVPLAVFSGTSTLQLHANHPLSRDVILKVKDSAKVSLPANVMQTVRELWFGEATKPVKSGLYGGSACTVAGVDKTYAAYFTGAGCIKVKHTAFTMILR